MINNVIDFRKKENLATIPDKAGFYKFYAPRETVEKLLGENFSDILPKLRIKSDLYYIYVGISKNLQDRLNWHINKHSKSDIKSGFLSTLRQSISALLYKDFDKEKETNEILDTMGFEFETSDKFEEIERLEIQNSLLPLNLCGNRNKDVKAFLNVLKEKRRIARNKISPNKEKRKSENWWEENWDFTEGDVIKAIGTGLVSLFQRNKKENNRVVYEGEEYRLKELARRAMWITKEKNSESSDSEISDWWEKHCFDMKKSSGTPTSDSLKRIFKDLGFEVRDD